MKYKIIVHMTPDLDGEGFNSAEERFLSAVNCAKHSIESIFYDFDVKINSESNVISIEFDQLNAVQNQQFYGMIKPTFYDSAGNMYPEFQKIEFETI